MQTVIDQRFVQRLKDRFGDQIVGSRLDAIDPWIELTPTGLVPVCRYLKEEADLAFTYLNCISVVDYLQVDPKKGATPPRLEVVYHATSITNKRSIVLKVELPRWKDDVVGNLPEVPSVTPVWQTADWHERECYDLSGVLFVGHQNLRRILCPEDWVGHPLRKDYEMPLEYHGIRGR